MSNTAYLQGPCMYAKVFENNRDMKGFEGAYEEWNGAYKISVGLSDEDLEYVLKWNKNYEPKAMDPEKGGVEGLKYITFKRRHEHKKKDGELIREWGGPPRVVDAEGNDWDTEEEIGNGSIVTVKLSVSKPKGSRITYVRLEKVRVDEHVPYEGGAGEEEDVDVPEHDGKIPF